ncbi:MAG: lytic transglycosylase domain-containing protein [Candidatus Baltobacteraceae bacterium]
MDIFNDIAAVTRRIAEITGQPAAAPSAAAGDFSGMVSSAMGDGAPPLAPTQGPNVIPPPQINTMVDINAGQFGVDPALIKAIMVNESGFDSNATSKTGAQGLMQLEPETAAGLGVDNAYDPAQNISGGTRYIRSLLERFHGDLRLAIAAYNAGPGAVEKYGGVPPYAETQNYVQNVLASYRQYKAP